MSDKKGGKKHSWLAHELDVVVAFVAGAAAGFIIGQYTTQIMSLLGL